MVLAASAVVNASEISMLHSVNGGVITLFTLLRQYL